VSNIIHKFKKEKMKKLKLLLLIAGTLSMWQLKAQMHDLNSLKFGCSTRNDTVANNTLIFKINKDSLNFIFTTKYLINTLSPNIYPTNYKIYFTDTLLGNLIDSATINSLTDSVAINIKIDETRPSGTYYIKFSFATQVGIYNSNICINKIVVPHCYSDGCQLMSNPDFNYDYLSFLDPFDSFLLGVVTCWGDAWGTPQLHTFPNYALMWHGKLTAPTGGSYILGEGIKQNLVVPVVSGKSYFLSVEAKQAPTTTVTVDNLNVFLTNASTSGLPIFSATSSGDPIPPIAGQQILNATGIAYGTCGTAWCNFANCFTATSNFDQMVLYPQQTIGAMPVAWIAIKSARLYDVTPQTETVTITCANPTVQIGNVGCYIPEVNYSWLPTTGLSNPTILNPIASPSVTTSYTLTITPWYNPSCHFTHTSLVVVQPPLPISFNIVNSQTICPGVSTTITAIGAVSYTWLPSGFTTNSIVIAPNATTIYTVNSIDVNGCSASNTVAMYVNTVPTLTVTAAPNVTLCPGANTILTALGGTTYTWQPTALTGNTIIVAPTAPTIYTVVSLTSLGCVQKGYILVNPISCCVIAGASDFVTTSGSVIGGTYVLNSPLILTGDLILYNVTIFMGTNAEIIVPNNKRFTASGSHLLGCPTMWKGISCSGTRASVAIIKNSLVEDAITAVDVKNVILPTTTGDPNILFLEDATFNKNYTSVNIDTYNSTASNFPIYMSNVVYTSRKLITPQHLLVTSSLTVTYNWPTATNLSALKNISPFSPVFNPDLSLQTTYELSVASYSTSNLEIPYANTIAHQGISAKDVYSSSNYNGLKLDAYFTTHTFTNFNFHNVYDNLHYGINALNTNITSNNAFYQYMQQYPLPCTGKCVKNYDGGIGINSVSNMASGVGSGQTFSLTVLPFTTGFFNKSTNFFINCAYGVKFTNIEYANIQFAIFHSKRIYVPTIDIISYGGAIPLGEYGVYAKTVDFRGININNNFTANINKAIIFIADFEYIFKKFGSQYVGGLNIKKNTLKANYGTTLSTRSMAQAIAVDNLLNQTTVSGYVAGTPTVPVFVDNNTIDKTFTGITITNWNKQRVIDNSNTITLVDNLVPTTDQYGIDHYNNTDDNMIGNTVKGFNTTKVKVYGLLAAENKGQSMWCNSTENTYRGVSFMGSQNLTSWKENKMKTHVWGMELNQTTIGTQGAMFQPINNQWNGTWAAGTYKTFVNTLDPALSVPNSNLYLSNVPSITQNGAVPLAAKYKSTATPSVSLFYTTGFSGVYCPIIKIIGVGSGTINPLGNFVGNLTNIVSNAYAYNTYLNGNRKNGKMATYKTLLDYPSLATGNVILQNFAITNATSPIGKLLSTEAHLVNGNITLAQSSIAGISPTDSVEQNTKRFYEIYINSKIGSYTTTDDADLQTIANGCPQRDGIVVYQARVLLNSIYDVYYHYPDNCANTLSSARLANTIDDEKEAVIANFIVYPNPTNGTIYFSASNMNIDDYTVTIYDVTGKVIYQKVYGNGSTEINTINLDLSNGVYLMQLKDNSTNDNYKQKIVIQK
jgi:hypothetical protein